MSDYEDIWEAQKSERCLSPAESELQFKAYIASKMEENEISSQCSSPTNTTNPRTSSSLDSMSSSSSLKSSTESLASSVSSEEEPSTEVIYSDPLDALEKATDTRIYNCPEFDETEEAIYEEAGGGSGVAPKIEVIKPSPKQSPKRRKRASISTATAMMPTSFKSEAEKHLQRRSHSYIQQSVTSKFSSIKSSSSDNKRLSAVLSKYIKPNIAKQTWQIDSSSWEFLHQSGNNEDIPETIAETEDSVAETTTKCKQDSTTSSSDKSKQTDSGLDSTLSFTNKSDDKDSVYESEMGTLNTEPNKSQLSKSQDKIKDYVTQQLATEQWMFGRMISQFNECTQRVTSSQILSTLSNIRQFINGMKNYLVRHGEGELHQIIKEERTKVFQNENV